MSNENRKLGNQFETRLCVSLSAYNFWCHPMTQNRQGQPFDVIAARNGQTHPIDCKVCKNNVFKLSRIEENQDSAMSLWKATGNGEAWFALELDNGAVYFISHTVLMQLATSMSTLSLPHIKQYGVPLGEWVSQCL